MEERLSKEEILERSQRENRNGDEMEKRVRIEGESFSLIFVFVMGIVLLALVCAAVCTLVCAANLLLLFLG